MTKVLMWSRLCAREGAEDGASLGKMEDLLAGQHIALQSLHYTSHLSKEEVT